VDECELALGDPLCADEADEVLLELELLAVELCDEVVEVLSVVAVELELLPVEPVVAELEAAGFADEVWAPRATTPVSTAMAPALATPTARLARRAG